MRLRKSKLDALLLKGAVRLSEVRGKPRGRVIELSLPMPPSSNGRWVPYIRKDGQPGLMLSERVRAYRKRVTQEIALRGLANTFLEGDLEALVTIHRRVNNSGDTDNYGKELFDTLQAAGVFRDDDQIVHVDTWRREDVPGGLLLVTIKELQGPDIDK